MLANFGGNEKIAQMALVRFKPEVALRAISTILGVRDGMMHSAMQQAPETQETAVIYTALLEQKVEIARYAHQLKGMCRYAHPRR